MTILEIYSWCGLATLALTCAGELWFEHRYPGLSAPLGHGAIALMCLFWPVTWLVTIVCLLASIGDDLS